MHWTPYIGRSIVSTQGTPVQAEVPRVMDAVRRIVRAARVVSRQNEKEIGISGAQLYVLQELSQQPAGSLNDLAERTTTHQSSVSAVVSRLVERGLVRREPSPEDARRVQIALTKAGRDIVDSAPPSAQAQLVAGLKRMEPDDRRMLAELMERWLRESQVDTAPAPFLFEDDAPSGGTGDG
jgi:DNA-binding MarR family transcriptional regulator